MINNNISDNDFLLFCEREKLKREIMSKQAQIIIKNINNSVEKSQKDMMAIDVEHIKLMEQLRENIKEKNVDDLDKIFERLR